VIRGVGKRFPLNDPVLRILCVGYDLALLTTRCAVLQLNGYHAEAVVLKDALPVMQKTKYDLVILPMKLDGDGDSSVFADAPEGTRIFQADRFSGPLDLIAKVDSLLRPSFREERNFG
jgi:hypothetical protein